MGSSMTVGDLAREHVVTVTPETTAIDIATTLADENVGSAVVLDGNAPVGIVTDRDLTVSVIAEGSDARTLTAADVMSVDLFVASPTDGIFDVLADMCDAGVRRIPVVEDDSLVGIVTLDDFLVLLATEISNLAGVVEAESPPY